MIDCGLDWLGRLEDVAPSVVVLTHAHVDHAGGLRAGHAPIRTQLDWCAKDGVARAIFTHCGSEIVRADPAMVAARVGELGRERGVDASIARDGMEISL